MVIEAALLHPGARIIGIDIDPTQISEARANLSSADLDLRRSGTVGLLVGDAMALPLPSRSVDCILSDLPFGRKHGGREGNAVMYPLALREMQRVLRPGGTALLLTTCKALVHKAVEADTGWQLGSRLCVRMGAMRAFAHVLQRSADSDSASG